MMALTPRERALVIRALVVIASHAARRITSDERNPDGAVPVTLSWLEQQLGVSHVTARRVLGLLSDGGKGKAAAIAVSAGSAEHDEVEQLRAGGQGDLVTAAGRKAAKLLAAGYVVAQVTQKDGEVRYSLRLTVPGLRWLRHVSTHPDSGVRTWRPTRLSGAAVTAADARAAMIDALADREPSRHPVAEALSTAPLPLWGFGCLPDGRPLPASAWITAVLDADGALSSDAAKRQLGVGSSREVRAVREWLTAVTMAGGGRLTAGLVAEHEAQDITTAVATVRDAKAAAAEQKAAAHREALARRVEQKAARRDAAMLLARAVTTTQKAALRAAGAPAATRATVTGHLRSDATLTGAHAWLMDARAGLPGAVKRRAEKGRPLPDADAVAWVVVREVTKRGGTESVARAQADAAVRALDSQWTWGLEAQLWVALNVGRVADGATVEGYLAWRDRVVGALRGHDAVRPQLADALAHHVAQKLADAGAPAQITETAAAAVREAGVAELAVPVF